MGTKPVHAVLGLALLTGAFASGCRSNGGGNPPGLIGNNTNSQSAFGRDPGMMANAPSSMKPATSGVNPQTIYGNDTNPTMATSGSSPGGTVRDYSNGVSVADDGGAVTNSRPTGWTSSPRANTMVPASGTTSASMTGAPTSPVGTTPGMSGTTSAGLTPVNYQPPPGAVPSPYPSSSASAFPSNGQDSFKERPTMSNGNMTPTSNASGSTMAFSPNGGTTSGDIGRTTPAPQVSGLPSSGDYHSVPSGGMPGQQ
jgi:hypothetical protein